MNKKRIIITISIIILLIIISIGIIKLYQTYAITNYVDSMSGATYDVHIKNTKTIDVPASGYRNIYYVITNNNPGTVNYTVAYSGTNVSVKVFSSSKDEISGSMGEKEKKFIRLRVENSGTTQATATISAILGYEKGGNLIIPSDMTEIKDVYTPVTLAAYIKSKYNNNSVAVNNDISYNIDTNNKLINDNNNNLRYYGSSPNNYIYFNCTNYRNQSSTNCEVWRIIGVIDNKVKIVRNQSIGSLAWDYDKNDNITETSNNNDWNTSTLQKLLNNQYYKGKETITYYSSNKSTTLKMGEIGLKNDITRNMIESSKWYLGGYDDADKVFSNDIYNYERGTLKCSGCTYDTTWTGNIALMYISDYGFAAEFGTSNNKLCTSTLYDYDSANCANNNWLTNIAQFSYFITPNTVNSTSVFWIEDGGYVDLTQSSNSFNILPTLYLSSNLQLAEGNGSLNNPYQLYVG